MGAGKWSDAAAAVEAAAALASSPLPGNGASPVSSGPLAGAEGGLDSPICSTGMLTMTGFSDRQGQTRGTHMAELPSSDRVEHSESVRCTSF